MAFLSDLKNNYIGPVFAHKLNFIATILTKNGVSLDRLLKGTDIESHQLNDPEYKVLKEQVITFYRNVLGLQIPGVNILLGDSIKLNDYGLYGCTLLCCKRLETALEFSTRYHNLVTKTVSMSLHNDHVDDKNGVSYFRFEDLLLTPDLIEFNIELQCAIVLSLARECLDNKDFAFDELRFSFDKPKHHQLHQAHFRCPISYGQAHNEFVLTNDKLLLKPPRSNPFAMPLLLDQCDMVLNSISTKNEFLIAINQWVAENMHKDIKSEDLASYLFITPRTLRRKMADQGTSFRYIVKELRCEAAKKLIKETQLTIEDIALSLGFNDTSNFRAAFKKWTGKTPSSLR
ncbi:MAG: AraC-like DNA-binding protein [Psychroserpens sp.]|jgi:AraC-like DNA-binding protein